MVETEDTKNKTQIVTHVMKHRLLNPLVDEESDVVVLEEDMHYQKLNSMLTYIGWKNDESEHVTYKQNQLRKLHVCLYIRWIYLHLIYLQVFLL